MKENLHKCAQTFTMNGKASYDSVLKRMRRAHARAQHILWVVQSVLTMIITYKSLRTEFGRFTCFVTGLITVTGASHSLTLGLT